MSDNNRGRTKGPDSHELYVEEMEAKAQSELPEPTGSERPSKCPQCGDSIVQSNLGGGRIDDYCEECGWPDEDRRENL